MLMDGYNPYIKQVGGRKQSDFAGHVRHRSVIREDSKPLQNVYSMPSKQFNIKRKNGLLTSVDSSLINDRSSQVSMREDTVEYASLKPIASQALPL